MAFKKFKKLFIAIADFAEPANIMRVINSLQSNIEDAIAPMINKTQNDSTILTNISLISGQNNVIDHTLNRKLEGWKVVRIRGQAQVWDTQDSNPAPSLQLWLHTSANVTVDLEVF